MARPLKTRDDDILPTLTASFTGGSPLNAGSGYSTAYILAWGDGFPKPTHPVIKATSRIKTATPGLILTMFTTHLSIVHHCLYP